MRARRAGVLHHGGSRNAGWTYRKQPLYFRHAGRQAAVEPSGMSLPVLLPARVGVARSGGRAASALGVRVLGRCRCAPRAPAILAEESRHRDPDQGPSRVVPCPGMGGRATIQVPSRLSR